MDMLITEQWVTLHLDHTDYKNFVTQTAGMQQFRNYGCARARTLYLQIFYTCTAADAKIGAEVATLCTAQLKIGHRNSGWSEDAKSTKYRSPWPKWKKLTGAPLWRTGDKGAAPTPQTLSVPKQLQRKAEGAASALTTQTRLSGGEVINVSKQDQQGARYSSTTCRVEDSEERPPARFRDLQYPWWAVNSDLFGNTTLQDSYQSGCLMC